MRLLTTGELLEVTNATVVGVTGEILHPGGLSPKELRTWVEFGVLTPVEGGGSQGRPWRFSRLQAVAVALAAQWWRFGAGLEMVKVAVETVVGLGEKGLARKLRNGRWLVSPFHPVEWRFYRLNKSEERDNSPRLIELNSIARSVDRTMSVIAARPPKSRRHRVRH